MLISISNRERWEAWRGRQPLSRVPLRISSCCVHEYHHAMKGNSERKPWEECLMISKLGQIRDARPFRGTVNSWYNVSTKNSPSALLINFFSKKISSPIYSPPLTLPLRQKKSQKSSPKKKIFLTSY